MCHLNSYLGRERRQMGIVFQILAPSLEKDFFMFVLEYLRQRLPAAEDLV